MSDEAVATLEAPAEPAVDEHGQTVAVDERGEVDEVRAVPDSPADQEAIAKIRNAKGQFTSEEKIAQQERDTFNEAMKVAGRDNKAPEKPVEEETEQLEAEQKKQEPEQPEEKPADTIETRAAEIEDRRVLRKTGLKDEQIDALSTDMRTSLLKTQRKVQGDYEKFYAERTGRKPVESDSSDADPSAGVSDQDPLTAVDGKANAQTPARRDPVIAKVLTEASEYGIDTKPLEQTLAQRDNAMRQMAAAVMRDRMESARESLSATFSDLKQDAAWDRVTQHMDRLDPNGIALLRGSTSDVRELLRDACHIEFGKTIRQQAQRELVASNHRQRQGQPSAESSAAPPRAMTGEERERMAYDAAVAGKGNLAAAQKVYADRMARPRMAG